MGLYKINGKWVSREPELMAKVVRFSLCMTEHCWGSPDNYLRSTWLAQAILRAQELNLISSEEIHFGIDQDVWELLMHSSDPIIQWNMEHVIQGEQFYQLVDPKEGDFVVTSKFRGIDPWILQNGTLVPLNEINPSIFDEFDILPSLKKGDSYCFSLGCRLIASVGSCPQFALESFTVFSDPCFFGLTL